MKGYMTRGELEDLMQAITAEMVEKLQKAADDPEFIMAMCRASTPEDVQRLYDAQFGPIHRETDERIKALSESLQLRLTSNGASHQ